MQPDFLSPVPGGPRREPSASGTFQRETGYGLIVHQSDSARASASGVRQRDKTYAATGDTLTVLEINGPDQLAVRVGAKGNPFIPIRRGMVIRRAMDSITVRLLGPLTAGVFSSTCTEALFATSFGDLVPHPGQQRKTGFEPGFFTVVVNAGAVYLDLLDPANWPGAGVLTPSIRASLGRYGGTLRLHNRSLTDPVYVYSFVPPGNGIADFPAFTAQTLDQVAWQIDPGQKEEFTFESSAAFVKKLQVATDVVWAKSIIVQTLGATVPVAALFSSPLADPLDLDGAAIGAERGVSLFG